MLVTVAELVGGGSAFYGAYPVYFKYSGDTEINDSENIDHVISDNLPSLELHSGCSSLRFSLAREIF